MKPEGPQVLVRTITLEQFGHEMRMQGVPTHQQVAFVCPMCATVQSAISLILADAGADFAAVEKHLGWSCVGRFLGAEPPRRRPDGKPCDWSLGGLFKLHRLEVILADGTRAMRFELATPAAAQALWARQELLWRRTRGGA